MVDSFQTHYLEDIAYRYRTLKTIADRALAQVRGDELFATLDAEGNSLAILMKHLSGNMIHNWTLPFAPDDDKPRGTGTGSSRSAPGTTGTRSTRDGRRAGATF